MLFDRRYRVRLPVRRKTGNSLNFFLAFFAFRHLTTLNSCCFSLSRFIRQHDFNCYLNSTLYCIVVLMDLDSLLLAKAGMWILQLFCPGWLFGAGLQWHSLWRSEFYLWWISHKKRRDRKKKRNIRILHKISAICRRFWMSKFAVGNSNLSNKLIRAIGVSSFFFISLWRRWWFLVYQKNDSSHHIVCNIMRRKWHSFIVVIWNLKFEISSWQKQQKKATFIYTHISLIHDRANADLIMNCCWNLHFVIGWLESRAIVSRAVVSATRSRAINLELHRLVNLRVIILKETKVIGVNLLFADNREKNEESW